MKTKSFIFIIGFLGINTVSAEECETNFQKEGNFSEGVIYSTWANIRGASFSDAYKKIYQHIAKDGWGISNADKDLGVISAAQTVSFGQGKTAPLNIVIEDFGNNSKVSIKYSLSGGVVSPDKSVLESFCNTIASAQ